MSQTGFWTIPNVLTLSRLPLAIILFFLIDLHIWGFSLIVFSVAAFTDWLDGWWARRFLQMSSFGRTFDPLTDKILIGGAFIFLIRVPESGVEPWMVAIVVGRELLITGIRGYVEALGHQFGADWFGKLKTILQCAVLIIIFLHLSIRDLAGVDQYSQMLVTVQYGSLYAMIAATVLSGVQYCVKAIAILSRP